MTFFLAPGETAEEFLASREAILSSENGWSEGALLWRDKMRYGTAFINKATGKRIPPRFERRSEALSEDDGA